MRTAGLSPTKTQCLTPAIRIPGSMGRLRCGLWCLVGVVAACPVHGRQIPKQPAPLLAVKMKELHEEITGCLVVTCYFVLHSADFSPSVLPGSWKEGELFGAVPFLAVCLASGGGRAASGLG